MGLFSKKINEAIAIDFFVEAYSKILSEHEMDMHKDQLRQLKEVFPLLKSVRQNVFDENLTAVNIQWFDIAWTKYYVKKHVPMMDAIDFNMKVQAKVPGLKEYEGLTTLYNQAFGSSYTDGNTAMAAAFVAQILDDYETKAQKEPEEMQQVVLGISSLFVKTYDISRKHIESHRLVS